MKVIEQHLNLNQASYIFQDLTMHILTQIHLHVLRYSGLKLKCFLQHFKILPPHIRYYQ